MRRSRLNDLVEDMVYSIQSRGAYTLTPVDLTAICQGIAGPIVRYVEEMIYDSQNYNRASRDWSAMVDTPKPRDDRDAWASLMADRIDAEIPKPDWNDWDATIRSTAFKDAPKTIIFDSLNGFTEEDTVETPETKPRRRIQVDD